MNQVITSPRIKLGLEDLKFGLPGETLTQERQGETVLITPLTEDNFPYDDTKSIKERMDEFDASADLVEELGPSLIAINANIDKLVKLKQFGVDGNNGNAGFLQGSNLANTRANINASTLSGSTLTTIKNSIDAEKLEGSNLLETRANINATALGGSSLSATRASIDAEKLDGKTLAEVKLGGNAATVEGYDEDGLLLLLNQEAIPDATGTVKGKVRLATNTERQAGISSAAVPVLSQIKQLPVMIRAASSYRVWKYTGYAGANTHSFFNYEIASVSATGMGETSPGQLNFTFTKPITGTALVFATGYSYRTITSGAYQDPIVFGNQVKEIFSYNLSAATSLVVPIQHVFTGGNGGWWWRNSYVADFTYFMIVLGVE